MTFSRSFSMIFLLSIVSSQVILATSSCKYPWEGFGVYLGALASFDSVPVEVQSSILDHLYNDLQIRRYRTEFPTSFSPSEDNYAIECVDQTTCSWITLHSLFAKLPEDKTLYASIWSPPHYMKDWLRTLKRSYEGSYYYYIKNVTSMVKEKFGLTVEKVSIINEPENMAAPWEECVMTPNQLCRLIQSYDDPLISICAENAEYEISQVYRNYRWAGVDCRSACTIITSHGYALSLNPFKQFGTVHYDLKKHPQDEESPVWITEISSTRNGADTNQMSEALDLSISLINFVGTTCVQRWYYWSAFTSFPSGESLIWYDASRGSLVLPKKYYAYRHFSRAGYQSTDRIDCSTDQFRCLQFQPNQNTVWVNPDSTEKPIGVTCNLCCTTEDNDYTCSQANILPSGSVCSCS